jgi:hypothetical protein
VNARRHHFWIFKVEYWRLTFPHLPPFLRVVCCRLMAKPAQELPPLHRLPPVQPGARSKQRIVGAKELARHLDLTHPRIGQLAKEQVLERLPDGRFNLDDSRVRYIRWLRDAERRTAKSKVDSDFVRAKTELIDIRIREKKRDLIEFFEAMEMGDKLIGTMLTAMGGMPTRVARLVDGNSFLSVRREVDKIVFDTRTSLANQFSEFAKQAEAEAEKLEQQQKKPATDNTEDDAA